MAGVRRSCSLFSAQKIATYLGIYYIKKTVVEEILKTQRAPLPEMMLGGTLLRLHAAGRVGYDIENTYALAFSGGKLDCFYADN